MHRRQLTSITLLLVTFVLSRLIFDHDNSFLCNLWFWQYLDAKLLRTDLLRSIWFLHSQPPLLNAMLGLVMKLFPTGYPFALQICFWILGITLILSLFFLLLEFEVPLMVAVSLTVLFELAPATLAYESWYYDTYPTAALLTIGTDWGNSAIANPARASRCEKATN